MCSKSIYADLKGGKLGVWSNTQCSESKAISSELQLPDQVKHSVGNFTRSSRHETCLHWPGHTTCW